MSLAVGTGHGAPATYADAFRQLGAHGLLTDDLTDRLVRATGFRNILVHRYEQLDMERVREAARHGHDDLRSFLRVVRDHLAE
jgi:uncharacterized protein YutE (UPF0331/DUF86 family)